MSGSPSSTPPDSIKVYVRHDWIWGVLCALCAGAIGVAYWMHTEVLRLELLIGTQEQRIKALEDRRAHEEGRVDEQGHTIDWLKGRLDGTR